jgi:hypothetical protein
VEVMVAVTVFTIVTLGVYGALIQSHKFAKLSRCHDECRAILRTYVDQFQRLQTTDKDTGTRRLLFVPTDLATGQGLVWGSLSDRPATNGAPAPRFLVIPIGTSTSRVNARLTRRVSYVDAATGATAAIRGTASTFLLQGVFKIEFDLNGRTYSQSMTVLRVVP